MQDDEGSSPAGQGSPRTGYGVEDPSGMETKAAVLPLTSKGGRVQDNPTGYYR